MQSALILKRENTLIYFQSAAASIIRTLQIKRAWRLVTCDYISGFLALITHLPRSLQRFPRVDVDVDVRFPFARLHAYVFAKPSHISS